MLATAGPLSPGKGLLRIYATRLAGVVPPTRYARRSVDERTSALPAPVAVIRPAATATTVRPNAGLPILVPPDVVLCSLARSLGKKKQVPDGTSHRRRALGRAVVAGRRAAASAATSTPPGATTSAMAPV